MDIVIKNIVLWMIKEKIVNKNKGKFWLSV